MPLEPGSGTLGKRDSHGPALFGGGLDAVAQRDGSRASLTLLCILGARLSQSVAIVLSSCIVPVPVPGTRGAGALGGPRGGVANLDGSLSSRRLPPGLAPTASCHTMAPLPVLLPVVGRLIAALNSLSRLFSRRSRCRRMHQNPASAARSVPKMDTTMAMMSCASENLSCWLRSSACA